MEIPYTVQARPDTGLWNAKIGIWLFLASEVMLFGGLFSAYIFLRVGADFPWPVHVLTVKWGFINTFVLIFSSVTVLQAWLALKMRQYARYKIWMALTIICALAFMVIKAVEYTDKFHHYGVCLQDGSVLEGHLPNNQYLVKFGGVTTVTLGAQKNKHGLLFNLPFVGAGSDAGFLKFLEGSKPEFSEVALVTPGEADEKIEAGKKITLDSAEIKRLLAAAVRRARKFEAADLAKARGKEKAAGKFEYPALREAYVKLTAAAPLNFAISPSRLAAYTDAKATFKDGTVIEGRLTDDTLRLQADKLDLRRLIPAGEKKLGGALASIQNADAWRVLGPGWKEKFLEHHSHESGHFKKKHPGQDPMQNADFVRDAFSMVISFHDEAAGHGGKPEEKKPGHKAAESAVHDGAPAASGGHHDHPELAIAKKDVAFYSNFTPKYNNYYAIYFALTGLHGLHVLGGALVLSYMLIFGMRIYKENPEHQANRVETAGLFWHFVDLIWIFLFPLLYLL